MMRLTLALLAVGATALRVTQECDNFWWWDSCTATRARRACAWEQETDCGYIYQDPATEIEFYLTCDEHDPSIKDYECSPCEEYQWFWDECVDTWSRFVCDVETYAWDQDGRIFYDLEWDHLYWWPEGMVQSRHDDCARLEV